MEYLSAYYWQKEDICKSSLVLKHLVYHKKNIPVIFGCICIHEEAKKQAASSCYTKELMEWFYRDALRLCKKEKVTDGKLENAFCRQLAKLDNSLNRKGEKVPDIVGIVCVGNQFMLWGRGKVEVLLLNTCFGQPHVVKLLGEGDIEELKVMAGILEKGVGILAAEKYFSENIPKQELMECLKVKELVNEERMQKRLKELGEAAYKQGGQQTSALLVATC